MGQHGWVRRCLLVLAVVALTACGQSSAADSSTDSSQLSTTAEAVAATSTGTSTDVGESSGPGASTSAAPGDRSPTCTTFYRASVTVPPDDGPVLTFTTSRESTADFADLHFRAIYIDDPSDVPSLSVRVETLPERSVVFAGLYQFADPAADRDAFAATGQGFTGLLYVYNPASGAETQFFCSSS